MNNELNETRSPSKGEYLFEKGGGADMSLVVRFPLMFAEVESNGRTYPKDVLAAAVKDLKARIARRKTSYAATDHKDDMGIDDIAAVLEDIDMKDTTVIATARILDTVKGRNVRALVKNGVCGVSAKGHGGTDEKGRVKAGLRLDGFDFVLNPSFGTFVGKSNILEHCTIEENEGAVTLDELKHMGLVEDGQAKVEEDILRQRYGNAVRLAGFKGTFEQYRESLVSKKG